MLCLADRFFPGYKLWQTAAKTGAELLWRTRQNARLKDPFARSPDRAAKQGALQERCSSSRNRVNPRGVKRKMSSYPLRARKRQRTRRIDVSGRIRIVK